MDWWNSVLENYHKDNSSRVFNHMFGIERYNLILFSFPKLRRARCESSEGRAEIYCVWKFFCTSLYFASVLRISKSVVSVFSCDSRLQFRLWANYWSTKRRKMFIYTRKSKCPKNKFFLHFSREGVIREFHEHYFGVHTPSSNHSVFVSR